MRILSLGLAVLAVACTNATDITTGFYQVTRHTLNYYDCTEGQSVDEPQFFRLVDDEILGVSFEGCDGTDVSTCHGRNPDAISFSYEGVSDFYRAGGGGTCVLSRVGTTAEQRGDTIRIEVRDYALQDDSLFQSEACTSEEAERRKSSMDCYMLRVISGGLL